MTMDAEPSPMLRDIRRQGRVLSGLGSRAGEFLQLGAAALAPGPGGRVFACGCGDGLFAAIAASALAAEAGLDWRPIGPLDLIVRAPQLRAADRVVAISMSGNVDRTVEAAAAAAKAGVPVLALVNGGGGRLGALCPTMVSLGIPDEASFLCGTSSYTGTVAALLLLAAGAGGQAGLADGLAGVADAMDAAITASEAAVRPAHVPGGVRLLAAGCESGTARYGAAKLVELTEVPAWHADLEEFAHSQYWSMPAGSLVAVVATDPVLARYAADTCDALGQLGIQTLAIEAASTPVASAAMRVRLPDVRPAMAPLLSAVPVQWLAYRLATLAGLDPDTRQHLKSDETRFRVSRLLTRRSLVGTGQ